MDLGDQDRGLVLPFRKVAFPEGQILAKFSLPQGENPG